MVQQVDFAKVCDLVVNEEMEQAHTLIREWFVSNSKTIVGNMLNEDNELANGNGDTKFFSGDDLADNAEGDEGASDVTTGAEAEAELADDLLGDNSEDNAEGGNEEAELVDKVADLEAEVERLKAMYDEIMGDSSSLSDDNAEDEEKDSKQDEDLDDDLGDLGLLDDDSELEDKGSEDKESEDDSEKKNESDDLSSDLDTIAEDEFAELDEAFELEKVAPTHMKGEVGTGKDIQTNDVSPLGNKTMSVDPDKRIFSGKPVEVRSTQKNGFDRETAPAVKTLPLRKNQLKKADDALEQVSKQGSKNAILNSKEGFQ